MIPAFLAKSLADLTFGGAFLWYFIKALVSMALPYAAIMLGIRWRKSKHAKASEQYSLAYNRRLHKWKLRKSF